MEKKNDGEIVYVIRGDDGNLEHDLDDAKKKVEKSLENNADKAVDIEKKKNGEIVGDAKKTVKEINSAIGSVEDISIDADTSQAQGQIDSLQADDIRIGVAADISKAESEIHDISADKTIQIGVDADISKAESRIKSVSDDKSVKVKIDADVSDAAEAIEGLEDTAENTAGNIKQLIGNAFGAAKGAAGNALSSASPLAETAAGLSTGISGAAVAAIGAGAAVAGIGAAAVSTADEMKQAMNQLQADTGASAEEAERYQNILEKVYANNYGDSFLDIAGGISQVKKNMGDMDDANLQKVTESAFALRDTFEYEIPESTKAAKAIVDNFGIDGDKAMGMIAAGAQNGLDYSGELLDSISEYSVQFSKLGFDADDMFGIFQKGAETGAFNLDKVGDAVKEFSIRAIDGSDSTKEGFDLLGLNADEMADKFSKGGESAKEAFQQTIEALAEMQDPLEQNTAGVDLFGTMWEDLGPEAVTALSDIESGAYDAAGAMDQIKDVKYEDLGASLGELKRNLELLLVPLGEALLPILNTLISMLSPIVSDVLQPILEAITPIIEVISDTLMPVITSLLDLFTTVFTGIIDTVTDTMDRATKIFKDIIDFIKNVFTGNWEGAWDNIVDIFENIIGGIGDLMKVPINAIIDGLNWFIGKVNSIKLPNWAVLGKYAGLSLNIPEIPRLKVGMDYVPSDDFPALLHEGEAVLTKQENMALRGFGGIQGLYAAQTYGDDVSFDYQRLERSIQKAIANSGDVSAPEYIILNMDGEELIRWYKDDNENYKKRSGGFSRWK